MNDLSANKRMISTSESNGKGKNIAHLQFITQPVVGKSTVEVVKAVCDAGVKWIQLRLKNADEFVWEQEAIAVWEVCQDYGAQLIINDNVELAARVMADGVHLGKEDKSPSEARKILGDGAIIGATANTFEDIFVLNEQPVDYIGLGPFAYTHTKENLSPILGQEGYEKIVKQVKDAGLSKPIIAVGGIKDTDVAELMSSGIYGIAVSGAIANSGNYQQSVRNFQKAMQS